MRPYDVMGRVDQIKEITLNSCALPYRFVSEQKAEMMPLV